MNNLLFFITVCLFLCSAPLARSEELVLLVPKIGILKSKAKGNKNCDKAEKLISGACPLASIPVEMEKNTSGEKVLVKMKDIKKLLRDTRAEICDDIKPASISLSIAATEEGTLIFVNGSAEMGFSMTIECKG